jgi:hypothetical protein
MLRGVTALPSFSFSLHFRCELLLEIVLEHLQISAKSKGILLCLAASAVSVVNPAEGVGAECSAAALLFRTDQQRCSRVERHGKKSIPCKAVRCGAAQFSTTGLEC